MNDTGQSMKKWSLVIALLLCLMAFGGLTALFRMDEDLVPSDKSEISISSNESESSSKDSSKDNSDGGSYSGDVEGIDLSDTQVLF